MRIYSHFNTLTGRIIFPCFVMALLLVISLALTGHASEEPSGTAPSSTNPHTSPPGPHTSVPSGIVGLALHITADRIGDPAQLIIRAVHPSGPAARAGITHGEEILTVNEEPVAGKTYQEAVRLIRGEVGSTVKLGLRGPQGERTVSLVRVSESVLMEQTPEVM
jgi:carboxyl-terminal processing protease